jgi:2-polyprenyl-3-methyl-5-hydroxy-6-metoxy-1,4-benzoquinol methylase
MNYRDKFYSKYVSAHTNQLYGDLSLKIIEKNFPVWRKYYGKFLPKDKNAKIIDLGCGNGGIIYWLQQIGYSKTEGVDISSEQIGQGRKMGIKNIFQADIKEFLNNKINQFDIIFTRDLIEHFNKEEIINILEQVYGSLKTDGLLIIQTTNAENPFGGRFRYGDFTHEISFTESSIRQVLLVSRFNEIKVYPVRPVIHGLKSLFRNLLWRWIELEIKFYLLVETGSAKGIFTQNLIAVAKK